MAAVALITTALGGWLFGLLWTAAAIVILHEWLAIVGVDGDRRKPVWIAGAVGLAIAGGMAETTPLGRAGPWLAVLLAAAVVGALSEPRRTRLWAAAGVAYAGVVAVIPAGIIGDPAFGVLAILWIFAVVWGTDIGAYFVGRAVGGPKLWPAVSPKKTWSGFIGGIAIGSALAVGLVEVARSAYAVRWHGGVALVGLTIVASIASQGGDLLESALKRHFGVKDAGHIIPGHGGVMDRLDSFWAVCLLLGLIVLVERGFGG